MGKDLDEALEEILDKIKKNKVEGLEPPADPIEVYPRDILWMDGLGINEKTDRGYLGLHIDGINNAIIKFADGDANPYAKNKNHSNVFSYLDSLNIREDYREIWFDCEDVALSTMAHARNKFPGLPIGIVSGVALKGSIKGQRHAFNILWWRKGKKFYYSLWDPMQKDFYEIDRFLEKIGEMRAIIAFPTKGNERVEPIPENFSSRGLSLEGKVIAFDEKRLIYPFGGDDGIKSYLEENDTGDATSFNKVCKQKHDSVDDSDTYKNWFLDYDRALWTFVHLRRAYPGCPVGLAIGGRSKKPGGRTSESYEILIWYRENDTKQGTPKRIYWRPSAKPDDVLGRLCEKNMDYLKTVII